MALSINLKGRLLHNFVGLAPRQPVVGQLGHSADLLLVFVDDLEDRLALLVPAELCIVQVIPVRDFVL